MTSKNQAYWNRLLKDYISGQITDEDRFLLEKKALDDPLLFEALEGYSKGIGQDQHLYLKKIEGDLNKELISHQRGFRWLIRVAASLIILVGLAYFFRPQERLLDENAVVMTDTNPNSDEEPLQF